MLRLIPALALLLAVGGAASSVAALGKDASLEAVNRALKGHRVTVELQNGTVVNRARAVVMGPEVTTWERAGERGEIATTEIQRVIIDKNSRVKKWTRRGAAAGAVLGAVGVGYSSVDGLVLGSNGAEGVAAGALAGAVAGAAGGALSGRRVVFDASD